MKEKNIVSNAVKFWLKKKHLKQNELAEAVGVDAARECCVEHEQLVIDDLLHTARAES